MNFYKQHLMWAGQAAVEVEMRGGTRERALQCARDYLRHVEGQRRSGERGAEATEHFFELAPRFSYEWCRSAFSCVEPSHRLAASLAATNVPADYVDVFCDVPWNCFMVHVPVGLVSDGTVLLFLWKQSNGQYAWFVLFDEGERLAVGVGAKAHLSNFLLGGADVDSRLVVLGRLAVNVCVELANRPSFLSEETGGGGRSKRASGEPVLRTYRLSRPVSVDLRRVVRDFLVGVGVSSSPSSDGQSLLAVQSLVMGHWKRQPCGPNNQLRKWIHVEAYWRGPEDASIALREHLLDRGDR